MIPLVSAQPNARTHVLEPLRPALIGVSLAHGILAALVAWLTWDTTETQPTTPPEGPRPSENSPSLQWFRPADFQSALPVSPSNISAQLSPPDTNTARSTSRYITFSRVPSPPAIDDRPTPNPPLPGTSPKPVLDAASLDQLDRLDEALYVAFMEAWSPPPLARPSNHKRTARLEISLSPEITLEHADLVVPSGSAELDLSIISATEKVAERLRTRSTTTDSLKFPQTLPSSFQNSRYICRIQFQIE